VALDYLILVPQADGYGKARARRLVAYDTFTGTTAGGALNTRVAPLGGTWATSGDATDFVFSDNFLGTDAVESLSRTVVRLRDDRPVRHPRLNQLHGFADRRSGAFLYLQRRNVAHPAMG
jgi:hypothetical protein